MALFAASCQPDTAKYYIHLPAASAKLLTMVTRQYPSERVAWTFYSLTICSNIYGQMHGTFCTCCATVAKNAIISQESVDHSVS